MVVVVVLVVLAVQKCSVLLGSPFPGPLARESRLLYFSSIIIDLKYCYKKILSKWVLINTVYIQLFVLGRHRHIEFKYLQIYTLWQISYQLCMYV